MTKVHNPGLSENFEEKHYVKIPHAYCAWRISLCNCWVTIWLGNLATETFVPHLWCGLVRTIYFQEIDGHPSVRIRYVYVLCIPYVFIHNHPEVDRISNIFATEDFLKYPYSIYSRNHILRFPKSCGCHPHPTQTMTVRVGCPARGFSFRTGECSDIGQGAKYHCPLALINPWRNTSNEHFWDLSNENKGMWYIEKWGLNPPKSGMILWLFWGYNNEWDL